MAHAVPEFTEYRILTAEELGRVVRKFREAKQWTQATLAELSGLTERTVQRVEKGDSASHDTRCAIARGFGFDNLNIFNDPIPMLNEEKYGAYLAALDSSTVIVDIERVVKGRGVRSTIEGAHSSASDLIGEPKPEAREAFAELVDNLRDYNDIHDCFNEIQRLELDKMLDELIAQVESYGCAIGVGRRQAMISFSNDPPGTRPMHWTNVFFLLANSEELPTKIRVPKSPEIGT